MKKVNLGDKYTHRVTLRLNDDQYNFLIKVSELFGVSPSDYLRMMVNTGMVSTRNDLDTLISGNTLQVKSLEGMVGTDEDVKTNSDSIV